MKYVEFVVSIYYGNEQTVHESMHLTGCNVRKRLYRGDEALFLLEVILGAFNTTHTLYV